jgi:ankyrin repeat protein
MFLYIAPYHCGSQTEGNSNRITDLTALHLATLCGNKAAVQYLLEHGASQTRICKEGEINYKNDSNYNREGVRPEEVYDTVLLDSDEDLDDVGEDGWHCDGNPNVRHI